MKLRDWRTSEKLTLKQLAEHLGIGGGKNPSRRVQRIETGEAPLDALLADRIVDLTRGAVSLQDLHQTRRNWLASQQEPAEAIGQ
jgi:transcriptional regulator with XRE-family HTH domain